MLERRRWLLALPAGIGLGLACGNADPLFSASASAGAAGRAILQAGPESGAGGSLEDDAPLGSSGSSEQGGTAQGGSAASGLPGGAGQEESPSGGAADPAGPAGTGGEADAAPTVPELDVIDDMEDGDGFLLRVNGRNGVWYTYTDGTGGSIFPQPTGVFEMADLQPARAGSTKALNVIGGDFTSWGATVAFAFSLSSKMQALAYDLRPYVGFQFWSKADTPLEIQVQLPNIDTDPLGGRCAGSGTNACFAHFSSAVKFGKEWSLSSVLFNDLKQAAYGRQASSFDAQHCFAMTFVLPPNQSFSVWIDDLALVR